MTDERVEELWTKAETLTPYLWYVRNVFARLVAAETAKECAELARTYGYVVDAVEAIRRKYEVTNG